jgi:hypothetical protein
VSQLELELASVPRSRLHPRHAGPAGSRAVPASESRDRDTGYQVVVLMPVSDFSADAARPPAAGTGAAGRGTGMPVRRRRKAAPGRPLAAAGRDWDEAPAARFKFFPAPWAVTVTRVTLAPASADS